MSAQALGYTYFRLSAQAFRTKHTHFPLYVGAGSGVCILSHVGTGFQNEAYTLSFVCRRRLWGIHTFTCQHRLLERRIHTFLCMSAQTLGYTYFCLRHRLLERGIHTFLCMSPQALRYTYFRLSAQAFRTKHTHFPLYVGAGSGVYILLHVGTGF